MEKQGDDGSWGHDPYFNHSQKRNNGDNLDNSAGGPKPLKLLQVTFFTIPQFPNS